MMKKHFIALADAMRGCKPYVLSLQEAKELSPQEVAFRTGGLSAWDDVIAALADFCHTQNPHFDRILWLDYIAGKCGPSGGKIKQASKKGGTT